MTKAVGSSAKIKPQHYLLFIRLLKPEVYKRIVNFRKQVLKIPKRGLQAPAMIGHTLFLLKLPPASKVLKNHQKSLDGFVYRLALQYALTTPQKNVAKLFVLFDLNLSLEYLLRFNNLYYKLKKVKKQKFLEIKIFPEQKVSKDEFKNFFKEVVVPYQAGLLKARQYRNISRADLNIYYWMVLHDYSATEFMKKQGYDMKDSSRNKDTQRMLNAIVQKIERIIDSL